jgi:pyruvate,water dikinase
MLLSLREAGDAQSVGGKAAALGDMLRAGVQVPPGFVLPATLFEHFLDASGHREQIQTLHGQLNGADPAAVAALSGRITGWLMATPLEEKLSAALRARFLEMDAERVVVRSSAIGEDSASASFAGQLDSFLDIVDEADLLEKVRMCWCSFYSARALAYQYATGVALRGMGVVVQPQIEGAVSGVAFTRSPVDPESLLIEYCEGSCEALVSGAVTPESVSVSRETRETQNSELLSAEQMRALVDQFLRLETHFAVPQDVEWTVDPAGQLHLLQSRPITVRGAVSDTGDLVVFSNANINENYPDPVTPLLQSIAETSYYHYFRNLGVAYAFAPRRLLAMEEALQGIVGVHAQRLYYNVSNTHAVFRMAPFGDLFADWFNRFVGVEATTEAREEDLTWRRGTAGRVGEGLELLRIARSVYGQYNSLTAQVQLFEQTINRFAERTTHESLRGLESPALLELLAQFIDIRSNRWVGATLADGGCMVCCGALEWFLDRHFDEPGPVLLHGLLRGLPDIVSSEPPKQLWLISRQIRASESLSALFEKETAEVLDVLGWDGEAMAAPEGAWQEPFAAVVQGFLDDWGFRCTGELMFTTVSFQEEPQAVVDMLRSYAGMEGQGPDQAIAAQGELRLAQTEKLASDLSMVRRGAFRWLLSATGRSLSLRERCRLKQALLYRRTRRVVLALGATLKQAGALKAADDVLFMRWQEILALREDAQPPQHAISERRRRFDEERTWPAPPPRIELPPGVSWTLMHQQPESLEAPVDGPLLRGLAAAAGKVTARATVARDQSDFHLVQAGDVLVAPQTDPGWATVLFLVRGLVMERGGMLSHGAIIAREFGIPSVVSVDRATERIPQGSTVTVDGDEGQVHLAD